MKDKKAAASAQNSTDPRRVLTIGLVSLTNFLLCGILYSSAGLLLGTIVSDMGFSDAQRTALSSAHSLGLVCTVFIVGLLYDRLPAKWCFAIGALCMGGISLAIRGFAQMFPLFYASLFMYGIAWGFTGVGAVKMFGLWLPRKEVNMGNAVFSNASSIGQIIGLTATVPIYTALGGWQNMYKVYGVIALVVAVAFMILVKNKRNEESAVASEGTYDMKTDVGLFKDLMALLKLPTYWLMVLADACVMGCAVYTAGAWGSYVLQNDPQWMIPASQSGSISMWLNIGSIFGYFIIPIFVDKIGGQKRFPAVAICGGILAAICAAVAYQTHDVMSCKTLLFIAGLGQGAIIPAGKIMAMRLPEVSGPRAGLSFGFQSTTQRVANTLMATLVGVLITAWGATSTVMIPIYGAMLGGPLFLAIFLAVLKKQGKEAI